MSECLTRSYEREHYGLAIHCAKRFMGRGVPSEELIAEAEAALLWAASRFDPERGVRFVSYAIPFVLGALRDICARNSPLRVPRGEYRLLCAADKRRENFIKHEGREPTADELGAALQMDSKRLRAMMDARERMRGASAGVLTANGAPSEHFEDGVLLRDAISRLPAPYAQVIRLRFEWGYSQAETARRLGVSQAWVSRTEKESKDELRKRLTED